MGGVGGGGEREQLCKEFELYKHVPNTQSTLESQNSKAEKICLVVFMALWS